MTTPDTIRRMLKAKQTMAANHIAGEVRSRGCRIIFEGAAGSRCGSPSVCRIVLDGGSGGGGCGSAGGSSSSTTTTTKAPNRRKDEELRWQSRRGLMQ
nr:unnamed protein product [Digitaria exilis]